MRACPSAMARDVLTASLVLAGAALGSAALLDWLGYTLFTLRWAL